MDTRDTSYPDRGGDHYSAALAADRSPPEHMTSGPAVNRTEGEPMPLCWPTRHPVQAINIHSVCLADIAEKLRGALGLPPTHPTPGETAATFGRAMPPVVHGLDVGGWIAWCLVGLPLFGERCPSLAAVRRESKRIAVTLAMLRARGRISTAAKLLGASRKVLRENLRAAGLYAGTTTALPNDSNMHGGE